MADPHAFTPPRLFPSRIGGPRQFISNLYPPRQRDALVLAAAVGDMDAIDSITDELVGLGLCRARGEGAAP